MQVKLINIKSIVTKSNLPDADFVINPYIGCQHACIYCYADFMRRFSGHTNEKWGEFVDVKFNAPKTIKTTCFGDKTVLIGSVTDPYQPLEVEYKITQKILEKLLPFQPNLEILTKSALIVRDIDLLKKFKHIKVGISLNSLDGSLSRLLEPCASSPNARLEALKVLHANGIGTYLFMAPIFPEITDYKKIIETSRDYVDEFLFENLNIRSNNKSRINTFIATYYPHLLETYAGIEKGDTNYWINLKTEIVRHCEEQGLKFKVYFNHAGEKK